MFKERRRFLRADYSTSVKWQSLTSSAKGSGFIPDVSKDISAGGIRLILYHLLGVDESIKLEFSISSSIGRRKIDLEAKVRWVDKMEVELEETKKTKYFAGLEFVNISEEDRDFINKFAFQMRTL